MLNSPKVSILIPLYNAQHYIGETIESCLNQSYSNIEIIIVDDGSTDESVSIVRVYEQKYQHISLYTQPNSGASVARNRAFSYATGSYIQYLDADDLLDPDKIRLQVKALKSQNSRSVAFGRWGIFYESIENVLWKSPPVNHNYDKTEEFLIELWYSGMAMVIYTWLIPRSLIEESLGWNEALSSNDDGEFSARIVMRATKLIFVEESIGYYRKDNQDSLSKKVSYRALASVLDSYTTYMKLMEKSLGKDKVRESLALIYSRYILFIEDEELGYDILKKEAEYMLYTLGYQKPLYRDKWYNHILVMLVGRKRAREIKQRIKNILS